MQVEHNTDGTHNTSSVVSLTGDQTISGVKTFTGNVIGIPMLRGFSNLKCAVATVATITITADFVYFASSTSPYSGYFAKINGTTYTNSITVAGPIINGRDQASAFTGSSWVHFYLIVNSTTGTIASLSSSVAPITGPTLPTGYDMWAYAGAVYVDGSTHLLGVSIRNNRAYYNIQQSALAAGTSESAVAVDLAAIVPPNASEALLNLTGNTTGSPTSKAFTIEHISGSIYHIMSLAAANVATSQITVPLTTAQTIYYLIDANSGSTTLTIAVVGYTLPNGAR